MIKFTTIASVFWLIFLKKCSANSALRGITFPRVLEDYPISTLHIDGMESYCIEPNCFFDGCEVVMKYCGHQGDSEHQWTINYRTVNGKEYVRFHSLHDGEFCLQATDSGVFEDGARIHVYECAESQHNVQLFTFEDGLIRPMGDPTLCMVYPGSQLIVDEPVILRDCDDVQELRDDFNSDNKGWSFDGY